MTWGALVISVVLGVAAASYSATAVEPNLRARGASPAAIWLAHVLTGYAILCGAAYFVYEDWVWLVFGGAALLAAWGGQYLVVSVAGSEPSSQPRLGQDPTPQPAGSRLVAVVLGAALGLVPAVATGRAPFLVCPRADRAAVGASPNTGIVAESPLGYLLTDPGPEFTLVADYPMSIEESAESRVDSLTLPQLREAGFVSAHQRLWIRDDGTILGNDAFRFSDSDGATGYHRAVTRYACQYRNETFDVPGGGVGLRIRYGSGDPIRDHVAWIDAGHRVVIAIGYREPPADHSEVLAMVAEARRIAPINAP
jgi:hypothetical protein